MNLVKCLNMNHGMIIEVQLIIIALCAVSVLDAVRMEMTMDERKKNRKNKRVKLINNFKRKNSLIFNDENKKNIRFRPDYFLRFRYNIDGLIELLKKSSGLEYASHPHLFQILDDLGHWALVRESSHFNFTSEIENTIRAQFKVLKKAFRNYNVSDILIWGDISNPNSSKQLVKILEIDIDSEAELFRVETLDTKASFLTSRYELDFWNATGGTLPVDHLIEVIDWDRDPFWLQKLDAFKNAMVVKKFSFNFVADEVSLVEQRLNLVNEIRSFFQLQLGELVQSGRSLGLLACGNGSSETSALVEALAIQALGQVFGIKSRLWGITTNFKIVPSFLVVDINEHETNTPSHLSKYPQISESGYRPIQRPLSEVLRRVLAADGGPFGRPESSTFKMPMAQSKMDFELSTESERKHSNNE